LHQIERVSCAWLNAIPEDADDQQLCLESEPA
jgi:hypothetical protein